MLADTAILGHDRFKTQHLTVDLPVGMPSSETSSAQAGPRETAGDAEIAHVPAAVCAGHLSRLATDYIGCSG